MPQEHTLTPRDRWFLDEHRLDPVTKGEFVQGDRIVICARCKTVSLRDSWVSIGGSCANCQGNAQLVFPFFSPNLLRLSASGNEDFKILAPRDSPAFHLPTFSFSAFSSFPSAKHCLYAGACSVVLLLLICVFTYSSLPKNAANNSPTEVVPEAFLVRHKQYLDWTHDWIGTKVFLLAANKMQAFENQLSGVNEKTENLLERTEIPLEKLSSLTSKAEIPLEKLPSLADKADVPLEKLSALTKKAPHFGDETPAQPERTEKGAESFNFVALSERNADGGSP